MGFLAHPLYLHIFPFHTPMKNQLFMAGVRYPRQDVAPAVGLDAEPLSISLIDLLFKRIKIIGSQQNGPEYLYEALDYVAQGKVKSIIETYPLCPMITPVSDKPGTTPSVDTRGVSVLICSVWRLRLPMLWVRLIAKGSSIATSRATVKGRGIFRRRFGSVPDGRRAD